MTDPSSPQERPIKASGKIPKAFTESARKRVFGRRLGRPMSSSRQGILGTLLPTLEIPHALVDEQSGSLSNALLFPERPDAPLVFEIGFGNGEHLKAMMEQAPACNYIGAEPFINGMSAFLKSIENLAHRPVRVWMDDALMVIRSLPEGSLCALYILNPDPWPKKRHHKRRIVNEDSLAVFHRALKPNGLLVMTTDVDDLAEWMVTQTTLHGGFSWQAQSQKDWKTMPAGWFRTRYEIKGEAAGRQQTYLLFNKKA